MEDQLPVNGQCQKIYSEMLMAPELVHQRYPAYYRADMDQVTLWDRKLFSSTEEYFGVLYLELAHSTGHPSRLDRVGISAPQQFASEGYNKDYPN